MKVGTWDNVFLHIYNDSVGEFLYKLKLISEEAPTVVSEIITAELGKYTDYPLMLENPTQEEVEVKWINNKKKIFHILQEKIIIPPGKYGIWFHCDRDFAPPSVLLWFFLCLWM